METIDDDTYIKIGRHKNPVMQYTTIMYIVHFLSFVVVWYPLFDFMVTLLALWQLCDFYYSSAGTASVSNFISQKLQYVITGPDLNIIYVIRGVWPSDLTCGLRCQCNFPAIIFPFNENYTDEGWWTLYGKRSVSEHCPVVASIFERFVDDGWCQIGYGNGPMGLYIRLSLRHCPNYFFCGIHEFTVLSAFDVEVWVLTALISTNTSIGICPVISYDMMTWAALNKPWIIKPDWYI